MRRLRKGFVAVVLSLLLLVVGSRELYLSPIEWAAAPYRYDLLSWEVSHLPDKWFYKPKSLLPWNSTSIRDRREDLREFFRIRREIGSLEKELADQHASSAHERSRLNSVPSTYRDKESEALLERLEGLERVRSGMKAGVEETMESEVSAVLVQEGLSSRIGLIFPPVDVALSSPPRVLVISPRDKISRMKTMLLDPGMKIEGMEELEEKIFREQNLSALVVGIGGVATYPTIVRDDSSLLHAAITASHEWLHIYWFFRPLGWNIFSNPEMNTLNETAADLAGQELGERVYHAITGEKMEELQGVPSSSAGETREFAETGDRGEDGFQFDLEMRETRRGLDELLVQGQVEEAEAFLEQRRQIFVENGFHIRKLNQAYFAFHGTYGASPASVSPIGGEVKHLRSLTVSVGDFIRTMSAFGSYQEFQGYLSRLSASGSLERRAGRGPMLALTNH